MTDTKGCDRCTHPGACCRGFVLNREFSPDWKEEAKAMLIDYGLSFMRPVRRVISVESGYEDAVMFDCDRLGSDGRCTDYEARPQLCKNYQAGTDALCAIYEFELKGIPIRVA
jgi:Fe-S-cluster containining protein